MRGQICQQRRRIMLNTTAYLLTQAACKEVCGIKMHFFNTLLHTQKQFDSHLHKLRIITV